MRFDPVSLEIRRAVFGGILASVWATCGWLAWLFGRALLRDPSALLGPLIGAVLGLAVHAIEHYREVARFEAEGGDWSEEQTEEEPVPRGFRAGLARSVIPLVLAFVALTCEHVLGHLLEEYLVPFLASLATLFPVGAVFALAFNREPEERRAGDAIFMGGAVGLGAAAAAFLMQWLMFGKLDSIGPLGWWPLVGMAFGLGARTRPLEPFRAVGGVVLAILFVVFCSLPAVFLPISRLPFAQTKAIQGVAIFVSAALEAPDMPARFWIDAEKEESKDGGARDSDEWPLGKRIAAAVGYRPPLKLQLSPADLALPNVVAPQDFPTPDKRDEDWANERRDVLGRELTLGWNSVLARSWLVVLLFAVGLGLAPRSEESLRPDDYPNSRTAANDRRLALAMAALVAAACLLVRLNPRGPG